MESGRYDTEAFTEKRPARSTSATIYKRPAPNERNGSPGRIRTSDMTVNSRPLYRLSYRGVPFFTDYEWALN
jgi:hypothetical protein